jgi:hypothetical protein
MQTSVTDIGGCVEEMVSLLKLRHKLLSLGTAALTLASMAVFAPPASATDVEPTGLTAFSLKAGFLRVNSGLETEQFFDLTPGQPGVTQCNDGVDNNDAPPIGTGHDGLIDYPADPQCSSPLDDSELAAGFQPQESVVVAGTVAADGSISIPKNVRTSEAQARSLGGIYFPPGYVPDATLGALTAKFQPAPGSNVNTPATGSINVDTGAVAINIAVRIKLEGGSGLTALGDSCYIPSGNNGIPLNFTTGTTSPPGPNTPISGTPYSKINGRYTVVDNSFAVGTAGTCGPLGLANSSINSAFGLAAPAGRNAASFTFKAEPILNRIEQGPVANAGPNQFSHLGAEVTLDASESADPNEDPITSYSWTQTGGPEVELTGADTAHPTFTAPDDPASLSFEVTVTSQGGSDTDAVDVDVAFNVPPVANAGPDQSGLSVGTTATLDATGSTDANLDDLSYTWEQTGGPTVELSDVHAAKPTFTTPATGPTTLTFAVTVDDGFAGGTDTDSVDVNVIANQNPVPNPGPNQTGRTSGSTVTLDASGSTDPDGHALTYTWQQASGVPVNLSDIHAEKPTFVVPPAPDFVYPHSITFNVTAQDAFGGEATSTTPVSIQVVRTTPSITAVTRTPSGTVYSGDTVTLGATVNNPDGGTLAYTWSQASGRTTSLSATNVANPTFVVPPSGATPGTTSACTSGTGTTGPTSANCPRFSVVVTNTSTGSPASGSSTLGTYSSTAPGRPVANAGAPQNAAVNSTVTLNGTGSSQAQGHALTYQWSQTGGTPVTLSSTTDAQPTFTAPADPETLTFSLVVTDPQNPLVTSTTNQPVSNPATTTVTVKATAVDADAGPDQTGKTAGQTITLDGTNSFEPTNQPLQYTWEQIDGPAVTLSGADTAQPTFVAPPVTSPAGYTATFRLSVTNGGPEAGDSDTDEVSVSVVASTPTVTVSRAPSGTVFTGDTVTLTANITNPDGTDPGDYTYLWSQVSGRTTSLSSTTAANPTYVVPTSGSSATSACTSGTGSTSATSANCPRFQVVVTKTNTAKASTAAALAAYASTLPGRPTANAGAPQSVDGAELVTLHGSGTQAQGRTLTYAWTQTGGEPVTLSSSTAAEPTFTAPNVDTVLTFQLITTDPLNPVTSGSNQKTSVAATTTVTVTKVPLPVADAGEDQIVLVDEEVTLDGTGSTAAEERPFTYLWEQIGGPEVTLTGADTAQPTFTAPTLPTVLTFRLTVDDGLGSTSDTVDVTVTNNPPVANAGASQSVEGNSTVTLDGSGSNDPDGHTLSYLWEQTGGPAVTLSSDTADKPTFTAPLGPVTLNFRLTVDDGHGGTSSAMTSVTAGGTPGLDLGAELTGTVKGQNDYSSFSFKITNLGTVKRTVSNTDISVGAVRNGEPIDESEFVVATKSTTLKAGVSTSFTVKWNHGDTLDLGDLIDVNLCVLVPGDSAPDNNCGVVHSPTEELDLSAVTNLVAVRKGSTSNTHNVDMVNNGTTAVSPVRGSYFTLSIQVAGEDPVILTPKSVATTQLLPGASKRVGFVWTHPKYPVGTEITAIGCVVVPGNVSAQSCNTVEATVVP